jgi:hypothetical protein
LELSPLSVLVGANASGKTNFVQLFRFLRDVANEGFDSAIALQGGIEQPNYAEFILVVTTILFRGPNANRANCERVVNSMLSKWNRGFTCEGKPVIFTINWEIGGKEKPYYDRVYMVPGGGDRYKRSWVRGEFMYPMPNYWKGRLHDQYLRPNQQHTCVLYSGDRDYDWMVAHEYGHLLGLRDRYRG